MPVEECIDAYARLSKEIFEESKPRWKLGEGRFKASNLVAAIKKTVDDQCKGSRMMDERSHACKVFDSLLIWCSFPC
jgi:hypothetical protein